MDKNKCKTARHLRIRTFNGFLATQGVLLLVLAFGLNGCLDIPDQPDTSREIETVSVIVFQEGQQDSSELKIRPSDSAVVALSIYPRQYRKELSFQWKFRTADSDSVLDTCDTYTIGAYAIENSIPNSVTVTDNAGNSQTLDFRILVNTAPFLYAETIPADGDTVYGNQKTAFKFKWNSADYDRSDVDDLFHTIVIDGTAYPVGTLTEIMQSGFSEGSHTFSVIVRDLHEDADTLAPRTFIVVDTLGGER